MSRPLSEPDAYLRRNSEADPEPTRTPHPYWRETKDERRARLAARPVFQEANIVTFGEQMALCRAHAERKRREELAMIPRCVY